MWTYAASKIFLELHGLDVKAGFFLVLSVVFSVPIGGGRSFGVLSPAQKKLQAGQRSGVIENPFFHTA